MTNKYVQDTGNVKSFRNLRKSQVIRSYIFVFTNINLVLQNHAS